MQTPLPVLLGSPHQPHSTLSRHSAHVLRPEQFWADNKGCKKKEIKYKHAYKHANFTVTENNFACVVRMTMQYSPVQFYLLLRCLLLKENK